MKLVMSLLRKVIPEGYLTILSGSAMLLYGLLYLVDTLLHDHPASEIIETAFLTHAQYEGILNIILGTATVGAADKLERLITIFRTYTDNAKNKKD